MDRAKRIQYIQQRLTEAAGPVRGSDLAKECDVTRQVIVGDVAHMRALGERIISSPRGYRMVAPEEKGFKALLTSQLGIEWLRDELYTIVDLGGAVLNLSVEHGFYGYLRMEMNVYNRGDVDRYLSELRQKRTTALSNLKDGIHRYLVETKTMEAMKSIRSVLHSLDEKCGAVKV